MNAADDSTGRFLFTIVAPQTDCEVLEIGAGRGHSTLWLVAGVRYLGGRVLSLEKDSGFAEEWRRNVADAGLEDWAELVEGEVLETLPTIDDVFDTVLVAASVGEHEQYFELVRGKLKPGALVIAEGADARYVAARRADPSLLTVTVPLGRGLELTAVLSESV